MTKNLLILFDNLVKESFQVGGVIMLDKVNQRGIVGITHEKEGGITVKLSPCGTSLAIPEFPIPKDMHHFIKGVFLP